MNKRPIKWHEDCLENLKSSFERARLVEQRAAEQVDKLAKDCSLLSLQITTAKAEGKTGFDREKYLINRA